MLKKKCFKCGETKPIEEFYKHPEMADGHLGKCKECTKKDVSENYRKNIDYYIEYYKNRNHTHKRKRQILFYQKKRRRINPQKEKAHRAVNNAVKSGRLIRQPCEVCGSKNVQAHHDDYSKPLEVRWLCFKHHRELHGQEVHVESF